MRLNQVVRLVFRRPNVNSGDGMGIRSAVAMHRKAVQNLEGAVKEMLATNEELLQFKHQFQRHNANGKMKR